MAGWKHGTEPHYTKSERLEEAAALFRKLRLPSDVTKRAMKACDGLWGREVTMSALVEMGKELDLEAGGKRALLEATAQSSGDSLTLTPRSRPRQADDPLYYGPSAAAMSAL